MKRNSIMWKYIAQEKEVLNRLLVSNEIDRVLSNGVMDIQAVYFVSHGSSFNAATVVSEFMAHNAGVRVYANTPDNFIYNGSTLELENRDSTIVIAISQTGTSRGTLEAVKKAKDNGFRILGLTDVAGSPLEMMSDFVISVGCGEEDSNAKTKGYSATLMQLMLLSVKLGRNKGCITAENYTDILQELQASVEAIPQTQALVEAWCERTNFGKGIEDLYVLGYGMNFGTALEGQLKLMETMCMPTMFDNIEEFSHGMHRAIHRSSTVMLIDTPHKLSEVAENSFRYLKQKTDRVVLLNVTGKAMEDSCVINLPYFRHTESVLLTTLAIQIISVFVPELNGKDPNADSNNNYTEFVRTRI
ncbi:MAG: SIS domain-containing protein [Clostridiaceae bacterium]